MRTRQTLHRSARGQKDGSVSLEGSRDYRNDRSGLFLQCDAGAAFCGGKLFNPEKGEASLRRVLGWKDHPRIVRRAPSRRNTLAAEIVTRIGYSCATPKNRYCGREIWGVAPNVPACQGRPSVNGTALNVRTSIEAHRIYPPSQHIVK